MDRLKTDKFFVFFFWALPWAEYVKTKCSDIYGHSYWLPKGRSKEMGRASYASECPFYEGYWLDGVYGAIECKLKGTIADGAYEYFRRCYKGGIWKGHTYCSYYREEMGPDEAGAKRQS